MKALFLFLIILLININLQASMKNRVVIDREVNLALQTFYKEVPGGKNFLSQSSGFLVFPEILKAGMIIGGEYGEGALIANGQIIGYYNTVSASIGFQLGIQKKSIIIAFLTEDALNNFRNSNGFQIGVDGSVAIANIGAGKNITDMTFNKDIVAFIYGNAGLMYNLTLEGTKINRIYPE